MMATRKLEITPAQLQALIDQFRDCAEMIGGGDAAVDQEWARRVDLINRMLIKNGLEPICE